MAIISYSSTKLASIGKEGIIKCDADGYYQLMIGALNVYNSAGELYTARGATALFEDNSLFQRRIQAGNLKGEMGHPKRLPRQNDKEYIDRMFIVEEKNVAVHYRKITLDTDFGKKNPQFNNPGMVAIIAELRPAGPFGPALKDALENKYENVCFSLRGFTSDVQHHLEIHRSITQIVTWDVVVEPGLRVANKWDSPALESIDVTRIRMKDVKAVLDSRKVPELAMEDSTALIQEMYDRMSKEAAPITASTLRYTPPSSIIKRW